MRSAPLLAFAATALVALTHAQPASAQGAPVTMGETPKPPAQPVPDGGDPHAPAAADPGEPARIRAAHTATRDPAILLDLAASLRRLGHNADAALVYEEWKADPRADPRRAVEVMHALAEIDATVGRLTIQLDDPLARVWLDGRELPGFRTGNAVRVDPGDHQVSAARAGAPPMSAGVRIGAREDRTVELRMGTYIAPGMPVAPPPVAPMPQVMPVVVTAPPMGPYVDGPRVAGTVFVVTGALGVATGVAAGIAAIALEVQSKSHCLDGGTACDATGVDLQHQSRTSGTVCSIALGGGGAFLLTGIILRAAYGHDTAALPSHVRVAGRGMEVVW
jgi:hypothetical protein